ncbi:MAG: extracellular solute-binding protein [Chloroflexi bacterium]|nr:extracellular solute-binding protein [Chloroflexota bacterium]
MNRLKQLCFYFLLVLVVVTAVSCKADDSEDPTNDNTEITTETNETDPANDETQEQDIIAFAVNGWERGLYEERIKVFEEANPTIKIELISVDELMGDPTGRGSISSEGVDESLLRLVQGSDVISWYLQPGFVQDGLLLDLAPLMTGDDNFDAVDYYPGLLEQFQWDGGTWGVPTSAGYILMFYDKDLFDNAGVAYPEAGWNWDDFLATAQAMTLRTGDEVTQWGFTTQSIGPLDLVQAKAGTLFNLVNEPPTARLEDTDVVAAFQWVADLHTTYEVAPYAKPPESEDDFEAFEEMYQLMEEGKIAMWPEYSEAYAWRTEDRNIGVVPFPVNSSDDHSTPIAGFGGSVLAISAGTVHEQAAWTWVKFLTQQHDDDQFGFGPGGSTSLPARKSVAESSGVWDEMDEELADALRYAVEHGFVSVYPPAGGETLYQAIDLIINEGRDAADVMAEAQQQFEDGMEGVIADRDDATPIPDFTVAEPPSSQIEEGVTVVRFVVAGGDPFVYRQIADQFNELHSDIVVKVEEPNFYNEEFSLTAMIGEADAFQWWNSLSSEEDISIVLPLQPLLDADPDLTEEDFFPAVLNQFRDQGQVVGLPGEVQVSFLNYNKRLFDAAGMDYPQAGWTIDDFLETAVALTHGESEEDKIYGYVPDIYELGDMMTFVARQDVSFIDDSVDPPTANFDDEDIIAALRWYTNLTTEYGVKPTFDIGDFRGFGNDPFQERQAIIDNDRAAIWKSDQYGFIIGYDENGEPISDDVDTSHIGVVPYPVNENGISSFETVNGYYIAAQTEVRQAAWEWLKFLTAQESVAQFGLPSRISTAESDAFVQRVGADKAAVMVATVQNSMQSSTADVFATGADWLGPAISIGLEDAYGSILAGDATVEAALQVTQEKVDNYRHCIIQNELIESNDYEAFEACLQEADLSWDR